MLVYGDARRRARPQEQIAQVRRLLAEAAGETTWIGRHTRLAAALIESGELAQGVADAAEADRGAGDPVGDRAMALVMALARIVATSWETGRPCMDLGETEGALAALDAADLPEEVEVRQPEGFAHYAVYPESYWAAARPLRDRALRVIGIRSIGTTLAAMAAAGAGAPCPVTVRPAGHPFAREVTGGDKLARAILGGGDDGAYAIADEGPGLSGSSIAAVASFLLDRGVPAERVTILPSHANGPGAVASPAIRALWSRLDSRVVTFDDLVLGAPDPRHRLEGWVADLVGAPVEPIREISGGAWRGVRGLAGADAPPVVAWQERRKFLLRSDGGAWLLKFAGLGQAGAEKLDRARRLADAGFVPEPAGYRHGFLVERWHEEARPLAPAGRDRELLLARIGAYLGFRARAFPVPPGRGAAPDELLHMARVNVAEELGEAAAGRLDDWRRRLPRLARHLRPVEIDGRLHAWEWLVRPDGTLLKTDALDHHRGHDLVGAQDIAWDIAGAAVEFALGERDRSALAASVEREAGRRVDPGTVRFMTLCYASFQLGYFRMAAASRGSLEEAARLAAAAARYRDVLERLL